MMLIGRIAKESAPWWSAEVDLIGAFTQGRSRKDAAVMLADLIETMLEREGAKITVTEVGPAGDDAYEVLVECSDPALLAARVLRYQREVRGMSIADVAKKLGASSRNAYASYEQGRVQPTLAKFRELLAVVAPDAAMFIGPRRPTIGVRRARPKRRTARRTPSAG